MDEDVIHKPSIEITVWSDLACPWCYLFKKRIDKAISELQGTVDVSLEFKTYFLHPSIAKKGEKVEEFMNRTIGDYSKWQPMEEMLMNAANKVGLVRNWVWIPNSLPPFVLLSLAKKYNKAGAAYDALYDATYEQGKNISLLSTLKEIATQLDLPLAELESALHGRGSIAETVVNEDIYAKHELGLEGVPYLVIGSQYSNKKYSIQQAQEIEVLREAFRKVLDDQE